MTQISEHFKRSEFECQCGCGFNTVDIELIEILETVRHRFMQPIKITSGCRCESHNYKVGGAKDSKHCLGIAADFKIQSIPVREAYDFLCVAFKGKYGFGLYDSWIHVDSRERKARW